MATKLTDDQESKLAKALNEAGEDLVMEVVAAFLDGIKQLKGYRCVGKIKDCLGCSLSFTVEVLNIKEADHNG